MSLLVGKAINLVRIKNESAKPALAATQVHDSLGSFIESLVAPPASHATQDYSIYILRLPGEFAALRRPASQESKLVTRGF
jgi:hypothetical protein